MLLRGILLAAAVLAPLLTYGAMALHERIVVAAAIAGERQAGQTRCAASIQALETRHNALVASAVAEARTAAEAIETPQSDAEIVALCNRSASCRDRNQNSKGN